MCIPASPELRDHSPTCFLTSLIWNLRNEHQCFHLAAYDRQDIKTVAQIPIIKDKLGLKLFGAKIEHDGVVMLVDSMSYPYLDGAQVDYVEDLNGSQFVVTNPNADATCGCGNSFSIAS